MARKNEAITLNVRPKWPNIKDDYAVWLGEREIGRIRRAADSEPDLAWEWQLVVAMALPDWSSGSAASLEAGAKELSIAWGRLIKVTDPGRLQRAFELAEAARRRWLGPREPAAADDALLTGSLAAIAAVQAGGGMDDEEPATAEPPEQDDVTPSETSAEDLPLGNPDDLASRLGVEIVDRV